ncbi:MAG: S9 family peptidase [Proteobacteria bacterium]|nr:S9 family peptidase [Pseudomonadota bacterium]
MGLALAGTLGLNACSSQTEQPIQYAQPALIEREALFGNPSRFQGRLSPDGTMMSFRAPLDGVMNLWVAPTGDFDKARAITHDTGRGVPSHFWTLDSASVLYIQDQNGDENWHLYRVDLRSGEILDLTPYAGVNAQVMSQSEQHPGKIVVGMNDRDARWHDAYLVDINSGEREMLAKNEGFSALHADNNLDVRLAEKQTEDGGMILLVLVDDHWQQLAQIPVEDAFTTQVLDFDADNTGVYMIDSRGRDKAALSRLDLATGEARVMAEPTGADISDVLVHPRSHKPVAVASSLHQREWHALDPAYEQDIKAMQAAAQGDAAILATTLDGEQWTVFISRGDRSPVYAVYDRRTKSLKTLFDTNPRLAGLPLAPKHNVTIKARDGLDLVSYLTLPSGVPIKGEYTPAVPQPLVLLVHGGPWARDTADYSGQVQWLANRGYAVLQVNFRGSTGFGKNFVSAGNYEWAGKMHDDLIDAVNWAVERRIAAKDQVAIMGGSYGGYSTLVGLTFTPEVFACGVAVVGPSNLNTLMESIPPYWEGFRRTLVAAIGDPETAPGRALLKERSPLTRVKKIQRPLMIAQGANDPRVKQAESDQIVAAMQSKSIPVTYVLYPDEGHGFQKPENNLSFHAVAENFLAQCLGGRTQPYGTDLQNSSIQLIEGANYIPGLEAALSGGVE